MDYYRDRGGSKFIFIALFIMIAYLAFFGFDIKAAYEYFMTSNKWFFDMVSGWFS